MELLITAKQHEMEKSVVFTHVVRPGMVLVVNDGGAKAPRRVDAGAGDRDGGQVDQEHREPDWERGKDLFIPQRNHLSSKLPRRHGQG